MVEKFDSPLFHGCMYATATLETHPTKVDSQRPLDLSVRFSPQHCRPQRNSCTDTNKYYKLCPFPIGHWLGYSQTTSKRDRTSQRTHLRKNTETDHSPSLEITNVFLSRKSSFIFIRTLELVKPLISGSSIQSDSAVEFDDRPLKQSTVPRNSKTKSTRERHQPTPWSWQAQQDQPPTTANNGTEEAKHTIPRAHTDMHIRTRKWYIYRA